MGKVINTSILICNEYQEWMEQNGGIVKTTKTGKPYHFLLYNCLEEEEGCRNCSEDDICDCCGVRLCVYVAIYVDAELLCPACWIIYTECAEDDRSKLC